MLAALMLLPSGERVVQSCIVLQLTGCWAAFLVECWWEWQRHFEVIVDPRIVTQLRLSCSSLRAGLLHT